MSGAKTFPIARIASAHGIRGEVKLDCFLQDPSRLATYFPLTDRKGKTYTLVVTGSAKGQLIARIEGVADRNAAETLRGVELLADATLLPESAEDEFYHHELIGLEAVLEDGTRIGTVVNIANFGAGDILEIKTAEGEMMLPFCAPFAGAIQNGKITITLPEEI